ncbi:hypothetical protein [Ensifer canadensis]
MTDDDLREFCLVGIFHLAHANWVNGVDDDVSCDVLEEAYQRGWTDMHIVFEKASVN